MKWKLSRLDRSILTYKKIRFDRIGLIVFEIFFNCVKSFGKKFSILMKMNGSHPRNKITSSLKGTKNHLL
ncbi:hypothetical protein LEP1GSC195_0426 [Leptospira wolbachii serovar Codice str. CDC]|uniref:Uncharacterized protein n=1 Tax=Leptospira wolbachii serovar Codice str. CDC TaxID=1218599 RepID=R9AE84_9LEPT|nr:hypothetical protein LEP1GSC195_0426 [Leptospira wolbachii serovar Codice str. CDC]